MRILGNRATSDVLCAFIHRCCTATSSASCRMKSRGNGKTRYNILKALIAMLTCIGR